jgi:hypothetical protein
MSFVLRMAVREIRASWRRLLFFFVQSHRCWLVDSGASAQSTRGQSPRRWWPWLALKRPAASSNRKKFLSRQGRCEGQHGL